MLTGLKVPSLKCKCVSYRPEHNANGNFEFLEMLKRNITTVRTQRVDEKKKKVSFFQVSCLLSALWSLKCQIWPIFVFSADGKNSVWAKYLGASEKSYLGLSENAMDYRVLSYH